MIVFDPDGENYAITRRQRIEMGQRVLAIAPFGKADPWVHGFNPLDFFSRTSSELIDQANFLASLLVMPGAKEPHWDYEATSLLAGLIVHVCERGFGDRDLPEVRRLLTTDRATFDELIEEMSFSRIGFVRRAGDRFKQKTASESSAVISSAQSHTHFLDSDVLARSLRSPCEHGAVLPDRVDFTIYVIFPAWACRAYSRWLRVVLGSILNEASNPLVQLENRDILFMVDKAHLLGDLDVLHRFHAEGPGNGLKFWLFHRNVPEMQAIYGGRWESLVANSEMIQAVGVGDSVTAEMLSVHTRGVLTTSDILGLSFDRQLLIRRGWRPIIAGRTKYHADPEFRWMFDDHHRAD